MQAAFSFLDVKNSNQKVDKRRPNKWTSRDLDIIEFLIDMKFSTLKQIHSRFFEITRNGEKSSSFRWTRERIAILKSYGFIKTVHHICDKTLYLATNKGYFFLRNSRPENTYSTPALEIDRRTFEHDLNVIQLRTHLEKSCEATNWISERNLSQLEEIRRNLSKEFRPDGIYTNSDGERIAFELEIARKAKDRYKQKVQKYIEVMTSNQSSLPFEKVHFICENEKVLNLIQSQAALYQPLFKFNLIKDFLEKGL